MRIRTIHLATAKAVVITRLTKAMELGEVRNRDDWKRLMGEICERLEDAEHIPMSVADNGEV